MLLLSFTDRTGPLIVVQDIAKTYGRGAAAVHALAGVSFECRPGEVYGLLGPNGAGKTTALRIVATAIRPTSGRVEVAGTDTLRHPERVRRTIGFLSANTGLYGRLTPRELLTFFGRLHGIDGREIAERIDELAATFLLADYLDRPCDKLSTGMKQKVNIARTVVHRPSVVVFDEPASGLDVIAGRAIADFIRACRDEGRTVIFSTHVMSEAARLCDRIGVIHAGKLLFEGTAEQMTRDTGVSNLEEAFIRIVESHAEGGVE